MPIAAGLSEIVQVDRYPMIRQCASRRNRSMTISRRALLQSAAFGTAAAAGIGFKVEPHLAHLWP
jgi:hypothetical protein